jgi:NTE family protein
MIAFPRNIGHRKDLLVEGTGKKPIAIACQGGGSHTAFTAGALKRLLRDERYEVVALNGTSGGAICALLAWYALLQNSGEGAATRAAGLLDSFWRDNPASGPYDRFWNDWTVWVNRLQGSVFLPAVSPYSTPLAYWGQERLRSMLEDLVAFEEIRTPLEDSNPMLLVGAVDVSSGEFRAFNSRRDRIGAEAILASTALPTLFRAVRADGGVYWDGLFSQNPPVRELTDAKPDEIWVIQIDPERRAEEPKSMVDILDRRNELAGNLSLHQEIYFIEKINYLIDKLGEEDESPGNKRLRIPGEEGREYRPISVRRIEMLRELDFASKLDRSPSFIRDLMDYGDERAEEFLAG